MKNLFTCDNCIFNPVQYQDVGPRLGYCLKHDSLLFEPSKTTCRFFRRKDLPGFLCEEGHKEHHQEFAETHGIVRYYSKYPVEIAHYSEKEAWLSDTFDPNIHTAATYYRSQKRWLFIQAQVGSRSAVKSIMFSSLSRRYISQCGHGSDNFRLALTMANDLREPTILTHADFHVRIHEDEFEAVHDVYLRDIALLKIYGIQEYGSMWNIDDVTWILDDLNGALVGSRDVFFRAVRKLIPVLKQRIIHSAQERGTFFTQPEEDGHGTIEPDKE